MRRIEFTTAAARRRKDPIILSIDEHEMRLKASVDIADIVALQDTFATDDEDSMTRDKIIAQKRALVDAMHLMIIPEDIHIVEEIYDDLDFFVLSEILKEVVAEYAGTANPTKPE
jgi:hypothetical protein